MNLIQLLAVALLYSNVHYNDNRCHEYVQVEPPQETTECIIIDYYDNLEGKCVFVNDDMQCNFWWRSENSLSNYKYKTYICMQSTRKDCIDNGGIFYVDEPQWVDNLINIYE